MNPGLRIDLHVHSRHSPDSRLPVRTLVEAAASRGLGGFALTDHNSVAGHPELFALAKEHPELVLVPGVEVSTREGHLLAFGIDRLPPIGASVAATVEWVHAAGGVPVPAHAGRFFHGVGSAFARTLGVPALETRNGHTSAWTNGRIAAIAAHRGLGSTGGSDVHALSDLGRCWTEFDADVRRLDEVHRALSEGRTRAGGHPMRPSERVRLAFRNGVARARRGFRPI